MLSERLVQINLIEVLERTRVHVLIFISDFSLHLLQLSFTALTTNKNSLFFLHLR